MKAVFVKVLAFFNLTTDDVVTVGKGAIIAGLGAGISYLIKYLSGHDFGIGGAVVMAILVNITRKSVDAPVEKMTGMKI